jgi:hypothetical protein
MLAGTAQTLLAVLSEVDARVIMGLFVMVPAALAGLAAVYAAQAKKQAAEANSRLQRNGGTTPADGLFRIEQKLDDYGSRLTTLEDYITNPKKHD